jgi:hypothetical protein
MSSLLLLLLESLLDGQALFHKLLTCHQAHCLIFESVLDGLRRCVYVV